MKFLTNVTAKLAATAKDYKLKVIVSVRKIFLFNNETDHQKVIHSSLNQEPQTAARSLQDRNQIVTNENYIFNKNVFFSGSISPLEFSKLSPSEQELLVLIAKECRSNYSHFTRAISTSQVIDSLDINPKYFRQLLHRLCKKTALRSYIFKKGNDPLRIYEMHENFQNSVLENAYNQDSDRSQDRNQIVVNPPPYNPPYGGGGFFNFNFPDCEILITRSKLATSTNSGLGKKNQGICKNASGNSQTKATSQPQQSAPKPAEPEEISWQNVDITSLKHIGMTRGELRRLKLLNTPENVQESILHFAWGLKHNKRALRYQDPLAVLMSVLRSGDRWIEPRYQSDAEVENEALQANLKASTARSQREREKAISEAVKDGFSTWRCALTDEDMKKILPRTFDEYGSLKKAATTSFLKTYFRENVIIPQLIANSKNGEQE